MKVIYNPSANLPKQCATIGFFDGVHLGHQSLINQLYKTAVECDAEPMVITFSNHPHDLFHPESPMKLLTPTGEKQRWLETSPVHNCLMLSFDKTLAHLTSEEFMVYLKNNYNVQVLLVGYDHHFGSDKNHDFSHYRTIGERHNIEVRQYIPYTVDGEIVSSSLIRRSLEADDIEKVGRLLGHPYPITGKVIHGKQIGRELGFPTANIEVEPTKMLPIDGVYAATTFINKAFYRVMLNIGHRPTIDHNKGSRTIEAHIIGYQGELYDNELTVLVCSKIRNEEKFSSLDLLKSQLEKDLQQVQQMTL